MTTPRVIPGDCLNVLRTLADASVDAIVTDPPYGLADLVAGQLIAAITAWANGDRERVPDGKGFMGKAWDRFVPPPAVWDECLRVLKPGGHLVAFAGSRTYDLMGLSIRMAGFEIRDGCQWIYGSGFPKSMDVSKAIDKAGGDPLAFRRFARAYAGAIEVSGLTHADVDRHLGIKSSSCYWAREDHRGGLPPRHHWEQARDLLNLDAEFVALYDEAEREVVGQSQGRSTALHGGGQSVGRLDDITAPATPAAQQWAGWGTALKPACEPIVLARKPLSGTVAANVLAHGTGGLNVDACRVDPHPADKPGKSYVGATGRRGGIMGEVVERHRDSDQANPSGRWPSNVLFTHAPECGPDEAPVECVPGCPVAELDAQSGTSTSRASAGRQTPKRSTVALGDFAGTSNVAGHDDSGGASRFFPTFRYQAKAPTSERPRVDGVAHPTVKPLALMRWLVRLVTPPGGLIVDPFAGSGTTGQAAELDGFNSILIENDPSYLPLIAKRLASTGSNS